MFLPNFWCVDSRRRDARELSPSKRRSSKSKSDKNAFITIVYEQSLFRSGIVEGNEQARGARTSPAALKRGCARVDPLVYYTSGLTRASRLNAAGDVRAPSLVRFPNLVPRVLRLLDCRFPRLSLSGKRDCS